jgi:hypothetical protein
MLRGWERASNREKEALESERAFDKFATLKVQGRSKFAIDHSVG